MSDSALDHAAALEREYGEFVAIQTIYINGARAFNVGDPVPASHVARKVVSDEQVAKQSTKAGQQAVNTVKES